MDLINKITVAIFSFDKMITEKIIPNLREIKLVAEIIVISDSEIGENISLVKSSYPFSGDAIKKVIEKSSTNYLMFINGSRILEMTGNGVEKFISAAKNTNTGWIYSDYNDKEGEKNSHHSLIDYQTGSIRDDFDFGQCFLINVDSARKWLPNLFSIKNKLLFSGIYDLRLTISRKSALLRITEPLYSVEILEESSESEKIFEYVDPKNRQVQIEMEQVAAHHLKRN